MNQSENIFGVILIDLWISLKLFWADSQWLWMILNSSWWFTILSDNNFGMILNDSWLFTNQSEIVLGQFSVILDDSQ